MIVGFVAGDNRPGQNYITATLDAGSQRPGGVGTPYGDVPVVHGSIAGVEAVCVHAFGVDDDVPSHQLNFPAQALAMWKLGVDVVVTYNGFGGLKPEFPVGSVIVPSDIIDEVHAKPYSIFPQGLGGWVRVDVGDDAGGPFCAAKRPAMVAAAAAVSRDIGRTFIDHARMVVVPGPRLETRSEIDDKHAHYADIIGTNMVPRAWYFRELGICYVAFCTITDFAGRLKTRKWANLPEDVVADIMRRFVQTLPAHQDDCPCRQEWREETLPKLRKSFWGRMVQDSK